MNPKTLNGAVLESTAQALALKSPNLSNRVRLILAGQPVPREIRRGMSIDREYEVTLSRPEIGDIIATLEKEYAPEDVIADRQVNFLISQWRRLLAE